MHSAIIAMTQGKFKWNSFQFLGQDKQCTCTVYPLSGKTFIYLWDTILLHVIPLSLLSCVSFSVALQVTRRVCNCSSSRQDLLQSKATLLGLFCVYTASSRNFFPQIT